MVKLDRETREAVVRAVAEAILERKERDGERWLTAEQLCEQFSMFNARWLKQYGWKLPRERVEYVGDDGQRHVTRWGYPMREIQGMIRDGRLRDLG